MNQNTLPARSMLSAISPMGTAPGAAPLVIADGAGFRAVEVRSWA